MLSAEGCVPDECAICLASEGAWHRLECGHRLHVECLINWFRMGHDACPICRSRPTTLQRSDEELTPAPHTVTFMQRSMTEAEVHRVLSTSLRMGRIRGGCARRLGRKYSLCRARLAEARETLARHQRVSVGRFTELMAREQELLVSLFQAETAYVSAVQKLLMYNSNWISLFRV